MEILSGLLNMARIYSTLILNGDWSSLGCLTALVISSIFGTMMNGYFLSAFTIQKELKRIENIPLWCAGFADALVTMGVIPIATIVLMSKTLTNTSICKVLHTLVAASTYSYSIFFTIVAGSTYIQVCHRVDVNGKTWKTAITFVAVIVFTFSFTLAGVGTYLGLDYNFCLDSHFGNLYFRLTTNMIHGTCFILTISAMVATLNYIYVESRAAYICRRTSQLRGDVTTMLKINLSAYLLYVVAWTPYLIVVNLFPDASATVLNSTVWIGIGRSIVTSMLYGFLSRAFRNAYTNIFYYCWCKTSLYNYNPRHARAYTNVARRGAVPEVRTHIMQNAVNISPRRASTQDIEL